MNITPTMAHYLRLAHEEGFTDPHKADHNFPIMLKWLKKGQGHLDTVVRALELAVEDKEPT